MKNIHIIPTDKPSNLVFEKISNRFYTNSRRKENSKNIQNQNIYITSDEKIKEGDWCIEGTDKTRKSKPFKVKEINDVSGICRDADGNPYVTDACKKIILTTDQDLIKDGVQSIDDEFLEWFVKNPSCEEVETIYGLFNPMGRQVDPMNLGQNHSQCVWKYKIIIPKEEPKERLKKILGTKHTKQERMYSEKEVMSILINSLHSVELKDNKDYSKVYNGMKEWFEQFKKK